MKHTEEKVIATLRKKHDVRIDPKAKVVFVLTGISSKQSFKLLHDLGIKAWGKIDYLVNHLRYNLIRVDEF